MKKAMQFRMRGLFCAALALSLVLPAACRKEEPKGPASTAKPASKAQTYRDKNGFFEFVPPKGWQKREYNDPRSKVDFFVPAPVAGRSLASLFFLSKHLSNPVNVQAEAENRVSRLGQMGSGDASVQMVDFAGVKAARVEASLPRQNMRMKVLMFTKHDRSYTISFTAPSEDFTKYLPVAEAALKTFVCIPPVGSEVTTPSEKERIQKEKIRVWITALKEQDLGTDAYNSLLEIGAAAIPALEEAQRTGTRLQKSRAMELLEKIRRSR